MKKINITLIATLISICSFSQTFKLNKSTGKLVVFLGKVNIEGYDGKEIIFSTNSSDYEEDERAKGLRAIDASGLDDNSGIGLNITEKQSSIEVRAIGKKNEKNFTIKVPSNMAVRCEFDKAIGSGTIKIKNVTGEVEVAVVYNRVVLENLSGPLTISTTYGKLDCSLTANPKGPISLVAPYGHVDLSVDPNIKANVNLYAPYGDIFASSDIKIDIDKKDSDMVSYSSSSVKGKINGGGLALSIKSNWGKIYLRKIGDLKKINEDADTRNKVNRNATININEDN
ncbi:MAG: hypothetical protein ACOVMI_11145 [Chitinophagaceae bacterium]